MQKDIWDVPRIEQLRYRRRWNSSTLGRALGYGDHEAEAQALSLLRGERSATPPEKRLLRLYERPNFYRAHGVDCYADALAPQQAKKVVQWWMGVILDRAPVGTTVE